VMEPPTVLFLCTANRCRSPMAAALLERTRQELGFKAQINSAGLSGDGTPPPYEVITVMADYGIDISAHQSHRLEIGDIERADLILGLERLHVREAVIASPNGEAWTRTFTIREFLRRARRIGRRSSKVPFATWIGELSLGRARHELLGASSVDDIADPIGGTMNAYRATAAELAALVDEMVELTFTSDDEAGDGSNSATSWPLSPT